MLLGAFTLCSRYKAIKKQREDVITDFEKMAREYCHLQNNFRDKHNELHTVYEQLRNANNDMDDQRKAFRGTIQDLDDQRHVDQEEIRSLKQHVSNTECDRDEPLRWLSYASRANRKLTQENQDLAREKGNLSKENQKLEDEKQKLKDTNQNLAKEKQELKDEKQNLKDENQKLKNEKQKLKDTNQNLAKENQKLEDEKQKFKDEKASLAEKDKTIEDLQAQRNNAAPDAVAAMRSSSKYILQLQTQLAKKDGEMSKIRAEKETASKDSAKTIAALQAELGKKKQVEEANGALATNRASSADNVQRLKTLGSELEGSRQAHAQCDKDSASQNSRIGELKASKEQLQGTLRAKNDEVATLQKCISDSQKDLEELQKKHATCDEHASSQASQLTQLHNANGSLQARIQTLNQTVDKQQQHVHTLTTNCPKCQDLRAALDAAVTDVKMSDDESRAEMKREVREEMISQVPDDLRRQLKVEVERSLRAEFQKHYSDLNASNSKRIQEQDRLIKDQSAELEKAKNISSTCKSHAACEKKEGNLLAYITKLENDGKMLRGSFSRLKGNAQNDREQLSSVQTANEDLRRELETIKADQRRAQNVNPLQSKLKACQREVEKMKEDRDKARNNCSIYSNNFSDLKKKYEDLEREQGRNPLDGDNPREDGHSETFIAGQKETIRTLQNEVAKLSKKLEDRKAGGEVQDQGCSADERSSTANRDEATALDVLRHEADLREARDGKKAVYFRPATSACPAPQVAGKKREHAEFSDGEGDDEEGDDCKKVKMHHLSSGD